MMRERRRVVATIDTIVEIVKDYTEGQVPQDARAVKLMFNPQERKAAVVVESDEFKPEQAGLPIGVKFELRRVYSV